MARKHDDEKVAEAKRKHPVERTVATPKDSPALTRETFEDALRRSSRKTSEPESEKKLKA